MTRRKIITYLAICISLGLAGKLYFDASQSQEPAISQAAPEVEDVTVPAFPKSYALGTFDDRFGISKERFLQIVEEAKKVWENAAGRDLFHYKPGAFMRVNLIFDWREEQLLKAKEQRAMIDENGSSFDMMKADYERKWGSAEQARSAYEESEQAFKTHLDEYNASVTRWNNGENRTESEAQYLESRKKTLEGERVAVEQKGATLKKNADDLNALGERIAALAKKFNLEVAMFNGAYVSQREFEKGVFDGKGIDIYEFDKEDDLRIALVHEFGHALGLEHVDNPQSIMYRKLALQDVHDIRLTSEDLIQLLSKVSSTSARSH